MKNFIMLLTYLRIFSGPVLFFLITVENLYGFSLILFLLASVSDYFDGYFARKFKMESVQGAVLDPIADKILTLFLILSLALELESLFVAFSGGLILARELLVAGLREFNSLQNNAKASKVSMAGKIKTSIQFFTFTCFLLGLYLGSAFLIFISNFFLTFALLLTLKSGLEYTVQSFKIPKVSNKND